MIIWITDGEFDLYANAMPEAQLFSANRCPVTHSCPPVAAKHERHTANAYRALAIATLLDDNLFPPRVLYIHSDWCCVGDVPQSALLGCDVSLHHVLLDARSADVNIQEPVMI